MLERLRMYVDEVGNHDLRHHALPNNRYLSLTGVVFSQNEIQNHLEPEINKLKNKHFGTETVILHRKEILNKRGPFTVLRDPMSQRAFDADLMELIKSLEYSVITCVIDKHAHVERYQAWTYHPYHYCLEILLERFVCELASRNAIGDVVAEARSKKDDKELKKAYHFLCDHGTGIPRGTHLPSSRLRRLTSAELKIKPKSANVIGLQFADLLAHPSFKGILSRRLGSPGPMTFGAQVEKILVDQKYRRSYQGDIEGYGTKWLP
jgi:hypothetical protein